MQTMSGRQPDRGIAMLVALFALLLLSVIGLGMMYSTNMETSINKNYRDKQASMYAAMAGLQSARDRIQPATLTITPPIILPSLSAAGGVIYIINPRAGETVAPWDYSNTYADTELCQEHILGLSGVLGVPCTASTQFPSLTPAWYTVVNDYTSSGVWHFTNPLDFKWVRITLKKNNNTPVAANGNSSDSNQTCWDGQYQIMLPTGYGPECNRIGSVISITVTAPGANYISTPSVVIDPPPSGGIQATAHANMILTSLQHVDYVTVTNGGANYNDQPYVTFTSATGSGAAGTVQWVPLGAAVASVTFGAAGTACYSSAPAVAFTGGGGSGAAATATLAATTSCIAGWTVTGNCPGHKGETISGVGVSGGGGSGFGATLTFGPTSGDVTASPIQTPGTGYTSVPTSLTGIGGGGGPCNGLTLTFTLGKRVVSPITVTAGGSGYTSAPTVSFSTTTATGATQPTATAVLGAPPANAGQITGVTVTDGGSGYLTPPVVTFSGTSGTGAMATSHIAPIGTATYKVGSITIDYEGYGYTTDPLVSFSGGGPGSGAMAYSTLGRGATYGKIYLLTALAQTTSGARSMLQMEVAGPVTGFNSTGALTIDGPNPIMQNMPNSMPYYLHGEDGVANVPSCGQPAEPLHPAIGGYDDPNADPPTTSVDTIVGSLPQPDHYTGDGGTPSVKNVYNSLGETMGTPTGLKAMMDAVNAVKTNTGSTVLYGSATLPEINYINGDVTLSGNGHGYGILAVTGTLHMSGDFSWNGVILVIGDGNVDWGGGGSGQITGTVLVAKIYPSSTQHADSDLLATLGSPTVNWNGGGGNGIQYDHCWATNIMSKVPFTAPPSTRPLKILSLRNLPY